MFNYTYLSNQSNIVRDVLSEKFTPENFLEYWMGLKELNNSSSLDEVIDFYNNYIKFSDTKLKCMADTIKDLLAFNTGKSLSTGMFTGEVHSLIEKNIAIYLSIIWNFNENPIALHEIDSSGKTIDQNNEFLTEIAQKIYELTTLQELGFFKHLTETIKNWYELGRALFVIQKGDRSISFKSFEPSNFEFRKNKLGQVVEIITMEEVVVPVFDSRELEQFKKKRKYSNSKYKKKTKVKTEDNETKLKNVSNQVRRTFTQYVNTSLTDTGLTFSKSDFWKRPLDEVPVTRNAWVKTSFTMCPDEETYIEHYKDLELDYCPVFFIENQVPKGLEAIQTVALIHNVMQHYSNVASEIAKPIILLDPAVNVEKIDILDGENIWESSNKFLKVKTNAPLDRELSSFFQVVPFQVNTVPMMETLQLAFQHLRQILDPNEMIESKGTARMTKTETLLRNSNDGLNFIGETHYLTSFFLTPLIKTIVSFCHEMSNRRVNTESGYTSKQPLPLYKVVINNQKTSAVIEEKYGNINAVLNLLIQAYNLKQGSNGEFDPTKMILDFVKAINQDGVDVNQQDNQQQDSSGLDAYQSAADRKAQANLS